MPDVREYLDAKGRSPFARWFNGLNAPAAAKVAMAVVRMEQGHKASFKSVGAGVWEYRIDFGPGYRIYLGKDGNELIILLGGGAKRAQQKDIAKARTLWKDYKERKKQEK